ncbi:MAG: NADH dehydrogenase (quinone) subunit D [Deltaproteobacteria bacterium]|nr:NADH dehydrogenase (quinone) subunit D [Deltaproteobacteria bacterium]
MISTQEVTLHMGPQHPSTHGVLHLILDIQGEKIINVEPDIGYLHRGTEKIAENLLYHQFVPYTDRLDYMCAMSNNLAYVMAVEKLLGLEITERAKYIRVISAELSRIAGHLLALGAWALDLGAMTILLYAMREREIVLDIFEQICGARMTLSYLRVGGVRYDFTEGIKESIKNLLEIMPKRLDEYEKILLGNRIWIQRNKGVGLISGEEAVSMGLSGPALRASGIKWDIRKDEPYLVYDRFEFDVPTGRNGDCLDRYNVRFEEIKQSLRIVKQALKDLPDGPFNVDMPQIVPPPKPDVYKNMEALIHHFKYVSQGFKVPKGEVYSAIEAPKGELGVYIVSDGTEKPYRLKLRVPSFNNLQTINHMSKGRYLADVIAIVSSLDPVFGECDK